MSGQASERETPLQGDILEQIISRVPTLDLVPASYVSKAWRRAVLSSFRRSPRRLIPWLIIHLHSRRNPSKPGLTYAYDPNSREWIRMPHPNTTLSANIDLHSLCTYHPGILYSLSFSKLAFSVDAFGSSWRELDAPRVWRTDAVVALVGSHLVVAGGTSDFEDDPCAVEVCAVDGDGSGRWVPCESMPDAFKERPAAMWLSVAVSDREMYVLDRRAGWFCSFDPETKRWGPTRRLRPDPAIFLSAIGLSGAGRLILVGVVGDAAHVEGLGLWEVDPATSQHREIGRMPPGMVEMLVGERSGLWSIGFSNAGDYGYIYNPSEPREMFLCELGKGCCMWERIGSPALVVDQHPMFTMAFRCSAVGMDDLSKLLPPPR